MLEWAVLETHPFGDFVPTKTRYLILGSFPGKIQNSSYDWFYGNGRNQFWSIVEHVYGRTLEDKNDKQGLFRKLDIAVADIIYQCERKNGSNLDNNLVNISYNSQGIEKILKENNIRKIYFTSRFVENKFKKIFKKLVGAYPEIKLVTLPSPSPRYAAISKAMKIKQYKKLLPKLP